MQLVVAALLCLFASRGNSATPSTTLTIAANSSGEEIQKALDDLPAGGEVVLVPGTYVIHQPITLRHDNQVLRGSGPSTILLLADNVNCPVVILGSPMNGPIRATTHLRLADLLIDGNRKNQQVELWHTAIDGSQLNNNGVDIWDADDVTVEHVICCRCRSGGLVTAVTRHLNLSDFTAYDNQFDGLACYLTEESHFTGLKLHDNLAAGISLDLSFNHNVITDALLTGNDLGVFMRASRNNVFKGITISKSHKDGVFMAQTAGQTPEGYGLRPGTECTDNDFDGLVVSASGRNAFMVNNSSCTNNIIRGARFVDNIRGGLVEADGKSSGVSLTLAADPVVETKPVMAEQSIQPVLLRREDAAAAQAVQAVMVHAATP